MKRTILTLALTLAISTLLISCKKEKMSCEEATIEMDKAINERENFKPIYNSEPTIQNKEIMDALIQKANEKCEIVNEICGE